MKTKAKTTVNTRTSICAAIRNNIATQLFIVTEKKNWTIWYLSEKLVFSLAKYVFLGSIKCAREGVIEHCFRSPFFKAEAHVGTSLRNRVSMLFYSHISYNSICYTLDFKQVACIEICMPHKNWLNFQKFRINFVCLCDSLYCK